MNFGMRKCLKYVNLTRSFVNDFRMLLMVHGRRLKTKKMMRDHGLKNG